MSWFPLCNRSDLKEGEGKYVEIKGFGFAVFLVGAEVFTIDNYCPHAGGNLAGGWVDTCGDTSCAVCPWHGWAFRLDNGQLRDSPAVKVAKYPTRITGDTVEADLPGL